MKYKVGDKVKTLQDSDRDIFPFPTGTIVEIIEVDQEKIHPYEVYANGTRWHYSEDMLEPYEEKTYAQGLADAWTLAKRLFNMDFLKINSIFGVKSGYEVMENFAPEEAFAKINAYEKEKEIKVGDVVILFGREGIVSNIDGKNLTLVHRDGRVTPMVSAEEIKKTGKHVDIERVFRQIDAPEEDMER